MRRLPLASLFLAVAVPAIAAELPLPLAPTRPLPVPPPPPLSAAAPRHISSDLAARLSAATPKFTAAPAAAAAPAPDLREIDRPRNQIIRLPEYLVEEKKIPALKERHILTPRGRLDRAYKRNPGLKLLSLPLPFLSNDGIALFMLEEELALERAREEADLWSLTSISENSPGHGVRRKHVAPRRPSEWIDYGGSFQSGR